MMKQECRQAIAGKTLSGWNMKKVFHESIDDDAFTDDLPESVPCEALRELGCKARGLGRGL
jgi:hypothetical protein